MTTREVSGSQPSFLESMPSGAKTCGKIMTAITVITALGACAAFCGHGSLAAAGTLVMFGGIGAFGTAGAVFAKIMCGTVENDEVESEPSKLPENNDKPMEKSNKHHEPEEI